MILTSIDILKGRKDLPKARDREIEIERESFQKVYRDGFAMIKDGADGRENVGEGSAKKKCFKGEGFT